MFKRVLIANRGEIAIRIARAAASLGVDTVAVFTSADSLSLHTRLADKAREIGKRTADPVRGYLDIDAVIAAAKASGSDCVHPGYGFLSENANFAERCRLEGLRFIGPSSATLALFGDKVEARAFAQAQGIPVVPGTPAALASGAEAGAMAQSVGYPVMLKAAAGGGGRGMRAVTRPDEMAAAFARCQSEALAAFGDGSVFRGEAAARDRVTSRSRCWPMAKATSCICMSATVRCSCAIRRSSRSRPAPGLDASLRQRILDDAICLARAAALRERGHRRVPGRSRRAENTSSSNATRASRSSIPSPSRSPASTSSKRSSASRPAIAESSRDPRPEPRSKRRAALRYRRASSRAAPAC